MPEFVVTNGSSHYIEKIVMDAKEKLVLVTPYLNLSDNFLKRLVDADRRKVRIIVVYGKSQLRDAEKEKLKNLVNLEVYFCQNLHAKCYHNEDSLLLTSMNLYEFSEKNNREMGVFFTRKRDKKVFDATLAEIDSIIAVSEKIQDKRYILSEDFSTTHNFHLPTLLQQIKVIHPNLVWNISSEGITISDFPRVGISFSLSHRLTFHIGKYTLEEIFKEKLRIIAKKNGARIFFDYSAISIYPPSDFKQDQIDMEGVIERADYFLQLFQEFTTPNALQHIKKIHISS